MLTCVISDSGTVNICTVLSYLRCSREEDQKKTEHGEGHVALGGESHVALG
jgi:hypothetical protein